MGILSVSLMYGPRKGFIAGFLGWELWAPIGKLSFSAYVIHFPLFQLRIMEVSSPEHFTPWQRMELWLGHATLSLFAAMCIWFLVEAPFATLAKLLIEKLTGAGKRKKKKQAQLKQPLLKAYEPEATNARASPLKSNEGLSVQVDQARRNVLSSLTRDKIGEDNSPPKTTDLKVVAEQTN